VTRTPTSVRSGGKTSRRRPSRAKPPDPANIVWTSAAVFTAVLDRGGYRFASILHSSGGGWSLFGLVTRSPEVGQTSEQASDAVLAHHAHQHLGTFEALDGPQGAMAFARQFVLTAPVPDAVCGCDEVGYTPKGPDP
jgi:hypothetical protein